MYDKGAKSFIFIHLIFFLSQSIEVLKELLNIVQKMSEKLNFSIQIDTVLNKYQICKICHNFFS